MATHHEKQQATTKTPDPAKEPDDLLLAARQQASPHEMLHALQSPDKPSPKSVLMLQRAYGNRATAQLLARHTQTHQHSPTHPGPTAEAAIQRETITKSQEELSPTGSVAYGWNYQYSVRFNNHNCYLTVKVKLTAAPHPDTGDTADADDLAKAKKDSSDQFSKIWDNQFVLVETATGNKYALRAELQFVDSGEDLSAALYKGTGRDNRRKWYTDSDDGVTRAHELGHQLGLLDEYEDPGVENRKDAAAGGVHKDHSIMGDYENEGYEPAEAKLRHGQHVAKDIADATGRGFSALKPGRVEMFFRRFLFW